MACQCLSPGDVQRINCFWRTLHNMLLHLNLSKHLNINVTGGYVFFTRSVYRRKPENYINFNRTGSLEISLMYVHLWTNESKCSLCTLWFILMYFLPHSFRFMFKGRCVDVCVTTPNYKHTVLLKTVGNLKRSKIYPKARVLNYAWQLCSGTLPSAIKMVLIVSLESHDFVCRVTWMKAVYFIFIAHYIA